MRGDGGNGRIERTPDVHEQVLQFWFDELRPEQWWRKDPDLDRLIAARFGPLHAAAGRCELWAWRATPDGRLAEVIVLDQFSRNIHRDSADAFRSDSLALALAQEAVRTGADRALSQAGRDFLYMPYMHSESLAIHDAGGPLFAANGVAQTVEFERRHREIVERFGRYPHRNAMLGRPSTPAEIEFLDRPGSSF